MKKLIAIALSVSVALAMLTGCGETSADEGGSDEFRTDSRFKEVEYCSLPSLRGATIYADTENRSDVHVCGVWLCWWLVCDAGCRGKSAHLERVTKQLFGG